MSELEGKRPKKRKLSTESLAKKVESFLFDDFLPKENERSNRLEIKADFLTKEKTIRSATFSLDKIFRSNKSSNSAKLVVNLFTLLNGNRKPNAKTLIIYLIQNKLIKPDELKSLLPTKKGGRKRKYLDEETGEIKNMTKDNKKICELWNQGKEPEAIRDEVFSRFRSQSGKTSKLFFVRRILRENQELLTRAFN